jgi:P27 family predicted phage terminase small subunit
MTKRGRKPADGPAPRGMQRPSRVESQPLSEVPDPPEHLGEHGKQYWTDHAPKLIEAKILTPLHLESFTLLCEQYHRYRRLSKWLDEDPDREVFTTENGYQQETPQVRMRDKALAALYSLWPKFGMTPFALAQMRKHGGVAGRSLPSIVNFAKRKYDDQAEGKQG